MHQLYQAVAAPTFTYAADIWFTPITQAPGCAKASGSVGAARWLESIQRITVTAITGRLHMTVTDIMEAHTNIPPVEFLMHKVCHRAATHLATLPGLHLLHKPVCTYMRRKAKHHLSAIHHLMRTYNINPDAFETITLMTHPPNGAPKICISIADSREESKEADQDNWVDVKVYMDGSGYDRAAGAATVLYRDSILKQTLCYHLGSLESHITYEAEAIGILLGLHLASHE